MKEALTRSGLGITAGLGLLIVVASFFVSAGNWNIDEVIYFLGADALAARGSFIVENGYETYEHPNLRILFLVAGPNGLAPQYPIGTAVLGAPFLALMGLRGLVVLSAISAAISLLLTYRIAKQLFSSDAVALTSVLILFACSFYLEFAFGTGAHALSVLAVLAALTFAIQAVQNSQNWPALFSGLILGLGVLIRLDVILLLPAIGFYVLLFSARPVSHIALGALGLVPSLVAGSVANHFKFGTWNPLSYGQSGGGTDIAGHIPAIIVVIVALLICIGLRHVTWRPAYRWGVLAAFAGLIALGLIGISPLARLIEGLYLLLIDIRGINDTRQGMEPLQDGVRIFFGQEKKALAQSLPWLGLLAVLLMQPWRQNRAPYLLILVAAGIWVLPFALRSWHGGFGTNMRYFLPMVPLLCILFASLFIQLVTDSNTPNRALRMGVLGGILVTTSWALLHPNGYASAGQQLSHWVFLSVIGLVLASVAIPKVKQVLAVTTCFALGVGLTNSGLRDLTLSQQHRAKNAAYGEVLSQLPRPNAFVSSFAPLSFQSRREDGLILAPTTLHDVVDPAFMETLLQDGYHLYVSAPDMDAFLASHPQFRLADTQPEFPDPDMAELVLSGG
ncbi:glycosyltransferase family 39 protein [Actibacterium pelagium]|uniref:Glycosyltransferase RgtA/B/C/D-like domain-containing protein n=1 Tax=Actibacterium pelagium TaxID=2029103 RepID=A0A917ABV7_9RHOB|nr:glycosyltransferase family 39 protein [Actibacterium pelagium]GGE39537.1 hypothetical protein GCM10011517_04050 [Actibacterium pelagium]